MEAKAPQPDAPFRSGITGKYKLLIKSVSLKFGNYEYALVDAEGKEYKVSSKMHYGDGQILRCMVSFVVSNARLVVTDTAVCSKQDFATAIPEPPKPQPRPQPKPQPKQPAKAVKPHSAPKQKAAKSQNSKPAKVVLGDPKHRKTTGTYIFRVAAVNQDGEGYSYKVMGAKGQLFEAKSKVYFPEQTLVDCHTKVALTPGGILKVSILSIKKHEPVIVKQSGSHHSSKPNKNWRKSNGGRDWFGGPNVGDHFHLIYTPMGNKR